MASTTDAEPPYSNKKPIAAVSARRAAAFVAARDRLNREAADKAAAAKPRGKAAKAAAGADEDDALDAFVALYPISSQYGTGWITDLDIKDTTPEASVDIIIADPPDFSGYSVKPSTTVKTFTASAVTSGPIPSPDITNIFAFILGNKKLFLCKQENKKNRRN